MRAVLVVGVTVAALLLACSAARQQKPDLPPPEYEPARSLELAPPAPTAPAPAASSSAVPED